MRRTFSHTVNKKEVGVLTYMPLMGGFLTGKYSKATPPPADGRFEFNSRLWQRVNVESNFARGRPKVRFLLIPGLLCQQKNLELQPQVMQAILFQISHVL